MTNAPLTVVLNDTVCVLTVTAIMSTTGVIWTASPSFALTGSYQVSPSWFNTNTFYANAKLSAVGFAADFVISVLYSDDQNLATGANTATLQAEVATATAAAVPAPNYTISLAGIAITTDVNDVVFSQSGTAALTAGSQVGQDLLSWSPPTGLTTYASIRRRLPGRRDPQGDRRHHPDRRFRARHRHQRPDPRGGTLAHHRQHREWRPLLRALRHHLQPAP